MPVENTLLFVVPPSNSLVVMSSKLSVVLSSNCSMVSSSNALSTATTLDLVPVKSGFSTAFATLLKLPIAIISVFIIASLDDKLPNLSTALIR